MIEYQPPDYPDENLRIFLAGSIEMGAAENWQKVVIDAFADHDDIVIFNPRRDDWDSSWEQSIRNPEFYAQVNWELDMLDACDIIILYFDPATKSPISLLELGFYAGVSPRKLRVVCPNGFWRKGNVDILCERQHVMLYESLPELINEFKEAIQ